MKAKPARSPVRRQPDRVSRPKRRPHPTAADLLRRHLAGDHAAFHELTTRHFALVVFVVLSRVGRRTAEDIAQNVFIALLEHAAAVLEQMGRATNPEEVLRGWLFCVAQNEATERNRAGQRHRSRTEADLCYTPRRPPNTPDRTADRTPELDALAHCLATLPAVLREYVTLRHFDALTAKAIGRRYGKAERFVARQLEHARGRLARCVERVPPADRTRHDTTHPRTEGSP